MPSRRPDVGEFERYLLDFGYQPGTARLYAGVLGQLHRSGGDPVKFLAQPWPRERRTVIAAALSRYAKWVGGEHGEWIKNALDDLPRLAPTHKAPEAPLSLEEWKVLYGSILQLPEPLRHVLGILARSGLRVSDVLEIERERMVEGIRAGVMALRQKGGSYRPFPVDQAMADHLGPCLAIRGWKHLWQLVSHTSQKAAYRTCYRYLKTSAARVGIEEARIHPHVLRHTIAYMIYLQSEKDILVVQKWLGHANPRTTLNYLSYFDPGLMAVVQQGMSAVMDGRRTR